MGMADGTPQPYSIQNSRMDLSTNRINAPLKVAQKGHPKGRLGSLAIPLMSQSITSAALPAMAP